MRADHGQAEQHYPRFSEGSTVLDELFLDASLTKGERLTFLLIVACIGIRGGRQKSVFVQKAHQQPSVSFGLK